MPSLACFLLASLVAINPDEKIDVDVLNSPGAEQKVTVMFLLQDQHLIGPSALDRFIQANKGADRLALRKKVIGDLKRTAELQQNRLSKEASLPADTRRLWILNAVACEMPLADIKKVAENSLVRYVYAIRGLPSTTPAPRQGRGCEPERSFTRSGDHPLEYS